MSKENLEQFIQQISDSEELQTRIGEEIDAESLIALGAEHGCEFTAEDLAEHAELSDEELDGVAGGQSAGTARFQLAGLDEVTFTQPAPPGRYDCRPNARATQQQHNRKTMPGSSGNRW